jgi:hypothetical protein
MSVRKSKHLAIEVCKHLKPWVRFKLGRQCLCQATYYEEQNSFSNQGAIALGVLYLLTFLLIQYKGIYSPKYSCTSCTRRVPVISKSPKSAIQNAMLAT